MEFIYIAIILILAIVFCAMLQRMFKNKEKDLKTEIFKLESIITKLEMEKDSLRENGIDIIKENSSIKSQLEVKNMLLKNQQEELLQTREQLNKDFKILANQIFEENTLKFTNVNKSNMETILRPLGEKLQEFKTKVEETYDKESKQRFSLEEKIRELVTLNNQISEDANNLTKALKGNNKIQGNWGEMILESILERSGLRKGEGYFIQDFITDKDGNRIKNDENKFMQPDVIVIYPGNRKIIIDSKVSLNGYVRYVESQTDEEKNKAAKEHLLSVKQHINELSQKSYQDYTDSIDFIMMFIPNEPAYMLAMQLDSTLWDYAYQKRILIISSTNLIASLKVVADLWKREYQSRNAQEIANRGTALLEKFTGFMESFNKIGKQIDDVQKAYSNAENQLIKGKGNLLKQAHMLKDLGIKTKKELPDYDDTH